MGKKFSDMTPEELSEAGRKGAKRSTEVRRQKKAMRETLDLLLGMPIKKGKQATVEDIKSFADLKGKNIDVQTAILIAQIQKALQGSVASAEYLRDTAGQRPEDIVKLDAEGEDLSLNISVSYGKIDDKEKDESGAE